MKELALVDRTSDLPLHVQVRLRVMEMIQEAPAGQTLPLPSESELVTKFGVSRITVRRALADLAAAGYVVRQAGRGSYALPRKIRHTSGRIGGASEEFRSQGFAVRANVIHFESRTVDAEVALRLGIPEDSELPYVKRVMIVDDKPISVVRAFLTVPDGAKPTVEDVSNESMVKVWARKWGIVPVRAVRTMEAALATDDDAELLGLAPPAAIQIADMVAFDAQGRGIFHVNVRYDGAYYKFVQEIDLLSSALPHRPVEEVQEI